jgi:hypothetical protein
MKSRSLRQTFAAACRHRAAVLDGHVIGHASMSETEIQQRIRLRVGRDPRIVLWRNNVGQVQREGRWIRYGLAVGSSDLIGILRGSGRFVALEVKTDTGRPKPEQILFIELVRQCGGFACIVRSPDEAAAAVDRACKGETQ